MIDESVLRAQCVWSSIAEIPEFPTSNFVDLRTRVFERCYTLGIDYSVANQIAHSVCGTPYSCAVLMMGALPYLVVVALVVAVFVTFNLRLLFGIPIAVFAFVMANPIIPVRRAMTVFAVLVSLVMVGAALGAYPTVAWLCAVFVSIFMVIRLFYSANARALRLAALDSEALFLFLYENHGCTVRDNETGRIYSFLRPISETGG
jgi:hypothetical protein